MGGDLLFHKQVQYHRRCEASAWLRYLFTNSFFFELILLSCLQLLSLLLLCRHLNSFFFNLIQLFYLQLLSLFILLPTSKLILLWTHTSLLSTTLIVSPVFADIGTIPLCLFTTLPSTPPLFCGSAFLSAYTQITALASGLCSLKRPTLPCSDG